MSVVHDDRRRAPVGYRALLRRLMILCPVTGRTTDTGLELLSIPTASARPQMLVDCLECGQDHQWQIDEALVERI